MALRIKSRWHDSERNESVNKGLDEHAGALAFIAWRISLEKARTLHGENYDYDSDGQRIAVICEYLTFVVQSADRLAHPIMDENARSQFITTLAQRIGDHVQDNAADLFGPGDYKTGFINTLNERSREYADYEYTEEGPSYSFTRHLGHSIQKIMGLSQTNKWVIDQVMEIDGPWMTENIEDSMMDLLDE